MLLGRVEIRRCLIFLAIIFLFWIGFEIRKRTSCLHDADQKEMLIQEKESWFSDCTHVYLDVGTNVGVQIRKVFEPHLYPNAILNTYFDHHFGAPSNRKNQVCVVGFEPNPRFERRLKELEKRYNHCGFKTKIYTKTAVSAFNKKNGATFWSDGQEQNNELGGTIVEWRQNKALDRGTVDLLRLSDFILHELKNKKSGGSVVMKMDIEGSELEVITDLLITGALSKINLIFVEWHIQYENKNARGEDLDKVKALIDNTKIISQKYNLSNQLRILDMDDETYYKEVRPLPIC